MTASERQFRFRVALAFGLVYVFWGSTYLGIRIAVEHIGPELMTGVRFPVAGMIMLAACALAGRRIAISGREFLRQGIIGALLLSVSNVTLAWAEQYIRSGLASLIVASIPVWFLVLDTWILRGERLSARGLVGLALGALGTLVLLWPKLVAPTGGRRMELFASVCLIASSFVWAVGSVLSRRWQGGMDAFTATGWQMSIGGFLNLGIAFLLGEPAKAQWTMRGLGAIAYLVVFGSLVGYTAYIWLLKNVPTSKVGTYAYVNPVIAVFLGWYFLGERVDGYIAAGTAIIIVAVALATSAKVKPKVGAEHEPELPACEAGAD
ncbi:MAG TPA: EamA family transporter [Terriglobales bacterium]|nr:EamA family transporter [Terriglobales bacterium]